jgi:type IV pilus assembly protein PilB
MADMDITKRRVAQDGHLVVSLHGKKIHFRVSTMPTVFGEKCVLRIMHQNDKFSSLGGVGMSEDEVQRTRKAFSSPQGLILVTGPTGSGKTTTLHAGLAEINDPELNIITLEDPVEATVRGVTHVQVNEKRFTFADGLRAVLRQDPDIVFVGEMRDAEVASIGIRAALTGHLVLSTLHTNGAAESLIRLDDLGVPRYLVSNCLRIVIAQRLLRRVCPACAEEARPTPAQVKHLGLTEQDVARVCYREGRGCDECTQTGYSGRLAVYEILEIDEATKRLIHRGASVEDIMAYASSRGMRVLLENGLEVAAKGDTTLSEIVRVFQKIEEPCGEPKPVQC